MTDDLSDRIAAKSAEIEEKLPGFAKWRTRTAEELAATDKCGCVSCAFADDQCNNPKCGYFQKPAPLIIGCLYHSPDWEE